MTADPVSWLLIEPGWRVADASGKEIGAVEEVLGDGNADIFHGLMVRTGTFSKPRYVAAEDVAAIESGRIQLS